MEMTRELATQLVALFEKYDGDKSVKLTTSCSLTMKLKGRGFRKSIINPGSMDVVGMYKGKKENLILQLVPHDDGYLPGDLMCLELPYVNIDRLTGGMDLIDKLLQDLESVALKKVASKKSPSKSDEFLLKRRQKANPKFGTW